MKRRPDPRALAFTGLNIVAFSGGPDSLCLLHLLAASEHRERVRAVHVDHDLDPESGERASAATRLAEGLGIPCRIERVAVDAPHAAGGPEAAARRARYESLRSGLAPDDHVLTAHHADDQVETMLLRMFRGAGPAGLSGMRTLRAFGRGWLGRPLLEWNRNDIEAYLAEHELEPVSDPSNEECSPDRNYLRHRILPEIESRWPGYRASIRRVRGWQAAAANALDREAAADWRIAAERLPSGEPVLDVHRWLALPEHASYAVIRHWCTLAGLGSVPSDRLSEFREQCRAARADRQPLLDWEDAQLRRYRDRLWLDFKPETPRTWSAEWPSGKRTRSVPAGGYLEWTGPRPDSRSAAWRLAPPAAGERLRIGRGKPRRRVGDILRESGIPPWRRSALPALYIGDDLAAVCPEWPDAELAAWMAETNARLTWHERPPTLLPSC
ncbi:MAG: tRNA lysidine(34) synthetase TilS [Candidatus Wenzhouxiangella sp. M2_3B_020]